MLPAPTPTLPWLAPLVPPFWLFTGIGIYSIALHYRSLRWPLLSLLLYCDCKGFSASTLWPWLGVDSVWGLLMCIWTSHSISMLFLEDPHRLTLDGKGALAEQTWWGKAWPTWNNIRLLGTPKSELPAGAGSENPPEGRLAFAIRRTAKLVVYVPINRFLLPRVLPVIFAPLSLADFDAVRQTFLRRLLLSRNNPITLREVYMRTVFALLWAAPTYIMIDAAHVALSLLFVVVLRANRPEEWPPVYGDVREAYTLRGFWGKFWHRLVVPSYSNIGKLVCQLFGIHAKSLLYRLAVACTVFVLSGAAHAVTAWQLGDNECWHLDIWWFFLNFVASTIESFLCLKVWSKNGPGDARKLTYGPLRRSMGYAGVFLFFFWSVPKWQYPKMYSSIMKVMNAI
ncbi:hypothetical protein LMH87_011901 [Akanthomyces muscarius]|uniref:Wax synthase domain-containing protein n=1 Tax=Akanthomyces muscarius TaxID=2231603 RepID=A0A9W8QBK2_AKAMU|nr:hypothetical protein LMH87_011901 [Akanthomyces muscarius]KAJ4151186.1 hypothetical protein LMH87_011901 [Akanthomyces muscarius]